MSARDAVLKGKAAIVTGASSGMGAEIAKELHAAGAKVLLVGRNKSRLESYAQSISEDSADVTYLSSDMAVVEAADGMPVLFDSGVRSGSDAAKALALGATAVGVGRPYAYALAAGGTDGVVSQLRSLLAELDLLMAIDGFPTIADLRAAGAGRVPGAV